MILLPVHAAPCLSCVGSPIVLFVLLTTASNRRTRRAAAIRRRAFVSEVSTHLEILTFAVVPPTRPYSVHLLPGQGAGYKIDLWSAWLLLSCYSRQIARLLVSKYQETQVYTCVSTCVIGRQQMEPRKNRILSWVIMAMEWTRSCSGTTCTQDSYRCGLL